MPQEQYCYVRLEIIGIVIAVLDAIKSLTVFGILIYLILEVNKITDELSRDNNKTAGNKEAIRRRLMAMIGIGIIFHLVSFVTAIIMIVGIIKENHNYILPWLIASLCVLILHFIDIVLFVTSSEKEMTNLRTPGSILVITLTGCFGVFADFIELQMYRLMRMRLVRTLV